MLNFNKYTAAVSALALFSVLMLALAPSASAAYDDMRPYNWYVMRTKDHSQPPLETDMAFISDHGGYYADKKHTEPDDPDKVIYLTFDAGYENGNVARILDTLKEKKVPGAFFVLDNLIKRNPELIIRMKDEGHLVCNHTAKHNDMSAVGEKDEFAAELNALSEEYFKLTGCEMAKYYRPPEGRFCERNLKHACELGFKTVFWSFAYADWDNDKQPNTDEAVKKVLDNTHNGAVILLHPTSKTNADIMGRLIDEWRSDGYRFGTLDELTAE